MDKFNPLPMIAEYYRHADMHDDPVTRVYLCRWVGAKLAGRYKGYSGAPYMMPSQIDLAIDCLIAAGIGREEEQGGTVYCNCSYG